MQHRETNIKARIIGHYLQASMKGKHNETPVKNSSYGGNYGS